jgi:para-nitrobenzyl esterase
MTKVFNFFVMLALISPLSHAEQAAQAQATIITTSLGQLQGQVRNGVLEFRGIPYAEPILPNQRWQLAKPVQAWQGILAATNFKSACAQPARFAITQASDSEDCLELNITLPKSEFEGIQAKRPVIVWLHGGAFIGGSGSLYRLDRLATHSNAIVVSLNYRLGTFGFLAHPAFDAAHQAGYALEDQRLALRWIKENIASFGGDPENITLFGESAGAAMVCAHLSTPEATRGLISKAIILSWACLEPWPSVEQAQEFGLRLAKAMGCENLSTALVCLRSKSTQSLIETAVELAGANPTPFTPAVGSSTIPTLANRAFVDDRWLAVPLIIGGTRDELLLYIIYEMLAGRSYTAENYLERLTEQYGDNAAVIAKRYPLSNYPSAAHAVGAAVSDFKPGFGVSHCLSIKTADVAAQRAPVYFLDFADATTPKVGVSISKPSEIEIGAVHSAELNYLFPGFSNTTAMSAPDLNANSQRTADVMLAYFGNFARTGSPNSIDLPQWELFESNRKAMRFDQEGVSLFQPDIEYQCDFWRKQYPSELD